MSRRYFYFARTESGEQHEFDVVENDPYTANVQAKLEVERWLREVGEPVERLTEFNLTHSTP